MNFLPQKFSNLEITGWYIPEHLIFKNPASLFGQSNLSPKSLLVSGGTIELYASWPQGYTRSNEEYTNVNIYCCLCVV